MKKLGICIIGAGHMGRIHARCWQNVAEAKIIAVMDKDESLARALVDEVGGEVFAEYQTAVTALNVDVVSICTPTFLHPQIAVFAMKQGKHVLCEKPIALTSEAAEEMLAVAKKTAVHFMIGLMRRHSPMMPKLRAWMSEGHLGRPIVAQTTNIMPLRPKRAMHDANANGGPLIDMIIHFVDTWSLLFESYPVSVMAQGAILANDREEISHIQSKAVDSAAIILTFKSGDVGNIFVSWGMPPEGHIKHHAERCLGPNGQLVMQFSLDHQTAVWHQPDGHQTVLCDVKTSMYQHEINAFAAEIRSGERRYETTVAAITGLKVSLGALKSIKSGQVVTI